MRLLLLILAGCTIDLSVGRVQTNTDADPADSAIHPDAIVHDDASQLDASEPDASDPDAGHPDAAQPEPRQLQINSTPSIMCADSLGGREGDFAFVSPSDVSFAAGEIGYLAGSSLILSGAPIESAFQTAMLVLDEDVVPDQPDGTYLGAVPIEGGAAGPLDTTVVIAAMFIDTLQEPPVGEAGFEFDTASLDGACFVSFPIMLVP